MAAVAAPEGGQRYNAMFRGTQLSSSQRAIPIAAMQQAVQTFTSKRVQQAYKQCGSEAFPFTSDIVEAEWKRQGQSEIYEDPVGRQAAPTMWLPLASSDHAALPQPTLTPWRPAAINPADTCALQMSGCPRASTAFSASPAPASVSRSMRPRPSWACRLSSSRCCGCASRARRGTGPRSRRVRAQPAMPLPPRHLFLACLVSPPVSASPRWSAGLRAALCSR